MRQKRALWAIPIFTSAAFIRACSDDSYIATNQYVDDAGSPGGQAGDGSGGSGASRSAVDGGGGCTPGEKQTLGTCEKCGASTQTCDEAGSYGSPVCEGQGACAPGDTTSTGCSDPCAEKKCAGDCTWGSCGLKTGAKCLYDNGSNFQCCGTNKWQFCSGSSCDWFSCSDCLAGSSCLNAC